MLRGMAIAEAMKVALQLCVTFSDDSVSNGAVWEWTALQGFTLWDWL